jgi:tripartite-type tricarboxylate transporter receptor subunit TctC
LARLPALPAGAMHFLQASSRTRRNPVIRFYKTAAIAAILAALSGAVFAQAYPSKPIRLILPFPGGSATDLMFRAIMEQSRERLGQPIVVEAKPGAGAVLASEFVMAQPADGYTLLASTSSQTITSAKEKPPFDVRKMTHVIHAVGGPLFLSVNVNNIKATTLKEFIDYARANPGKVNFGSYGSGSLGHLAVELFNRVARVNTVHIPFNGSAADALALAQGTSDASMNVMTFIDPQVKAGKVRVLAATSQERAVQQPEIPGMREAGLPDYNVIFWQGIAGPGGMSREIVLKLNAAFNAALKSQPVIDYANKVKNNLYGGTPEAITELVNREVDVWAKLIKDANLTID